MEKTEILLRTAKGEQEVVSNVNKLPIKHRSVLIMIDGKVTEAGLLARCGGTIDSAAILQALEIQGFIERKPAPAVMHPLSARAAREETGGSLLEGLVDKVKDVVSQYETKS